MSRRTLVAPLRVALSSAEWSYLLHLLESVIRHGSGRDPDRASALLEVIVSQLADECCRRKRFTTYLAGNAGVDLDDLQSPALDDLQPLDDLQTPALDDLQAPVLDNLQASGGGVQ